MGDRLDFLSQPSGEIGALGEILPEQTIADQRRGLSLRHGTLWVIQERFKAVVGTLIDSLNFPDPLSVVPRERDSVRAVTIHASGERSKRGATVRSPTQNSYLLHLLASRLGELAAELKKQLRG
jgi:hypothetical protein